MNYLIKTYFCINCKKVFKSYMRFNFMNIKDKVCSPKCYFETQENNIYWRPIKK